MKFRKRTGIKLNKVTLVFTGILVILLSALTITSLLYFNIQIDAVKKMSDPSYKEYGNHYVLITDDNQDSFWDEVYQGALNAGEESNVYVERFGEDLAVSYTKAELMEMAIAAKVNGIIVEADQSEEMKALIDQAEDKGIPVVTVMTDCYGSKRQSFIGLGSYNLGREYGREIIQIANENTKKVLILMNANTDDNNQNILYTGINETLSNEGNHLNLNIETKIVNDTGSFSSEEAIRDIFIDSEQLPDIIICLDEENTLSTYQAVVDYNLVGDVKIIGYYTSDTILKAISQDVISATIAVDSKQIGKSCVDSLNEFINTAHVSDFVTLEVTTVTQKNLKEYLNDDTQTGN